MRVVGTLRFAHPTAGEGQMRRLVFASLAALIGLGAALFVIRMAMAAPTNGDVAQRFNQKKKIYEQLREAWSLCPPLQLLCMGLFSIFSLSRRYFVRASAALTRAR
jgi:hypothetical protein